MHVCACMARVCVYVCTSTVAHMRSHDDEFYSVTCIHDMCAMPCICVVVFQVPIACHFTCMHEKHWYSSRAAASASHLMRMSCKIKHGEFLCKVAVTCMQILLLLITILLSQMQFLHATSSFLLVLYPTPSLPLMHRFDCPCLLLLC